MRVEHIYCFNKEDVQKLVGLIAETYHSSYFHTGRAKREFNILFPTEEEKNVAESLMKRCSTWHLKRGCPEELRLNEDEFSTWKLLEAYCVSLSMR